MPVTTLPLNARLLHIGPHKTGSTSVQMSFHTDRARLSALGVHYAGERLRPKAAAWSIGVPGQEYGLPRPGREHWRGLVQDVASAGDRRVVISNEDFGRAKPPQIEQAVADLGGEQVHVVAVARRLDRYLPSQWQERVRAGLLTPYDAWLREVLDRGSPEWSWERRNVWFAHDTRALVSRWLAFVPAERFTLIVIDESDHHLVHRTFEQLTGLPEGTLREYPHATNRGLSQAESELVQAVHARLEAAGWDQLARRPVVKGGIIVDLLTRPAPDRKRPPLPVWAVDTVRAASEQRVAAVRASGIHVAGDVDHLLLPEDVEVDGPDTPPTVITPEAAAAAVVAAVSAVVRQRPDERGRLARLAGRVRRRGRASGPA